MDEPVTPNELINFMRVLKMQQIRKQLDRDYQAENLYLKHPSGEWTNRYNIVKEFFEAAKEQS